jgi:subtilisin family serine protease
LRALAGSPEITGSEDFAAGVVDPGALSGSGAILLRRLGVAVVQTDPRITRELHTNTERPLGSILAVEPERYVRAFGCADDDELAPEVSAYEQRYLRGYHDAVEHLCELWAGARDRTRPRRASMPRERYEDNDRLTWGLQAVGASASAFLGARTRLAVLDTGLAAGHPDFEGREVRLRSFVAGHGAQDRNGHGTHCAGIAGGCLQPAHGPRYGVAPHAELHVGRVLDDHGVGVDAAVLAGIEWAVAHRCAVVSLSLGSPTRPGEPYSRVFEIAARRALDAGTLIIAATGNQSDRPNRVAAVSRPASCPSILAVGAVSRSLSVASFSNGRVRASDGNVDLVAPGVAVHSSWPAPGITQRLTGTSMAAPHVAGLAALWSEASGAVGRALWRVLLQSRLALPQPLEDAGAGLARAPGA